MRLWAADLYPILMSDVCNAVSYQSYGIFLFYVQYSRCLIVNDEMDFLDTWAVFSYRTKHQYGSTCIIL